AVALQKPTGCELTAYTVGGQRAWSVAQPGQVCAQPILTAGVLLLPISAGDQGVLDRIDPTDGALLFQVPTSAPPTTAPLPLGNQALALGSSTGVHLIAYDVEVASAPTDATVTALARIDDSRFAAVLRGIGEPEDSAGRTITRFVTQPQLLALEPSIELTSPIRAAPVVGTLAGDADSSIVAGGPGWVAGWATDNGEIRWRVETSLGPVTGVALDGSGRVVFSESGIGGTVRRYDPVTDQTWALLPPSVSSPVPYASPLPLCGRLAIGCDAPLGLVIFEVAALPGLLPSSWPRPFGGAGNDAEVALTACPTAAAPCVGPSCCTTNLECDDDDPCTVDSCIDAACSYKHLPGCCSQDAHCTLADPCSQGVCVDHACESDPVPGCCVHDAQCQGPDACTKSNCVDNQCQSAFIAGCCLTDDVCSDDDPCTATACQNYQCVAQPVLGCCHDAADCDDGDPCTLDACLDDQCVAEPIPGCCALDEQCDDGEPCSEDVCVEGQCQTAPIPGCCLGDQECDDADPCTTGVCADNQCQQDIISTPCCLGTGSNCCATDAECDDTFACTTDQCIAGKCVHQADPTPPGCCATDGDCQDEDPCTQGICSSLLCYQVPVAGCCTYDDECGDYKTCTLDLCVEHACIHPPDLVDPACCGGPEHCDDDDPCTSDLCSSAKQCKYVPIGGCCTQDSQCDDLEDATTDTCLDNACVHQTCDVGMLDPNAPTDIVFVIDQSGSMNSEIPAIQSGLAAFSSDIAASGLDYRVTVMAGKNTYNPICVPPPLGGPGCTDTAQFQQINQGIGSYNALTKLVAHLPTILAFFRPNSARHFVAITDDESSYNAATFDAALTAGGVGSYVFHSVVGLTSGSYNYPWSYGYGSGCSAGKGTQYLQLSDWTGGTKQDICSPNWTALYATLANDMGAGISHVLLSHPHVTGSVVVTLDGNPAQVGVDYALDDAVGKVFFPGGAQAGVVVEACYDVP
ncbi:MAG: hypothetical protein ACI9WU_005283, partial [Myxococcota bacterium]